MSDLLQFEPWGIAKFSTLFWKQLAAKKLNEFLKGRKDLIIKGFYEKDISAKSPQLFFSTESFETEMVSSVAEMSKSFYQIRGKLVLCDTIEEFKALDRLKEATKVAQESATCENLDEIDYFLIFAFADVKKFKFYHQICYPIQLFSKDQISCTIGPVFEGNSTLALTMKDDLVLFNDPSNAKNAPGWPLRQLLVNITRTESLKDVKIVCIRENERLTFTAHLPNEVQLEGVSGWERSAENPSKIAPVRTTDISALIDPIQLAKQAGELNLKLMKWRLIPDLDLEVIKNTSCLLIGSGTLGCNVLRILLGWGFRKISLIDSGKISYSNPVRQSLFTFEDAKAGAPKAETAATRALQIDPNASIEGFDLCVPMPGHLIIDEVETKDQFDKLFNLISSHEVIFLLTDSRESRWLPALIGHSMNKIVITAGLGFDSFVVMRHGVNDSHEFDQKSSCYFCHDVIGPSDTLTGRSLDQQCTVTRPGLSYLASAFSVELLVSLLQIDTKDPSNNARSRLGSIPHQIRGNLSSQEVFNLTGSAFEHCTCCSETILKEFEKSPWEFVKRCCNDPKELENISGLTAMKQISHELEEFGFENEIDSATPDDDVNDF